MGPWVLPRETGLALWTRGGSQVCEKGVGIILVNPSTWEWVAGLGWDHGVSGFSITEMKHPGQPGFVKAGVCVCACVVF